MSIRNERVPPTKTKKETRLEWKAFSVGIENGRAIWCCNQSGVEAVARFVQSGRAICKGNRCDFCIRITNFLHDCR